MVRGRLQADRDAAPRHGAPERRRLRQPFPQRLPGPRPVGHGPRPHWDFIIVHESAHEWWGNNISAQDHADMWVHESFANYAEGIYTECRLGKSAGAAYMIGARRGVRNDRPVVPVFGVNAQGSGDMYPKGGNMLHTIRAIIDDDAKWRGILRGLNKTFYHQTVTGKQVQDYISREAGI